MKVGLLSLAMVHVVILIVGTYPEEVEVIEGA